MPHTVPLMSAARRATPALQEYSDNGEFTVPIGAVHKCPSADMRVMALLTVVCAARRAVLWFAP